MKKISILTNEQLLQLKEDLSKSKISDGYFVKSITTSNNLIIDLTFRKYNNLLSLDYDYYIKGIPGYGELKDGTPYSDFDGGCLIKADELANLNEISFNKLFYQSMRDYCYIAQSPLKQELLDVVSYYEKNLLFEEERQQKAILWKYDSELGIAYFCSKCKTFICGGDTCINCSTPINWNKKIKYNGKVHW